METGALLTPAPVLWASCPAFPLDWLIGVHELADSSVNFRCWAWTATADYLTVRTEITRRVKEEFDAAGISIPFPQRDVHVYPVAPKGRGEEG